MVDTGEMLQKLHLYLEDTKESFWSLELRTGYGTWTKQKEDNIDFDFQAINETRSQNQTDNQQSWYEELCRQKL